jgi:hypothetical protein
MAQPVLENVCKLTDSESGIPNGISDLLATSAAWTTNVQTLLTGWSEIVTEASKKLGELLGAQLDAGLKAGEVGLQLPLAKDPQDIRRGLGKFWQKSFDCLGPMTEAQMQAIHFLAALWLHVVGGMKTVSEEVYRRRLGICEVCEFFHDNHCLQCGCRMAGDVVAKARWTNEQCPAGKWEITTT